MDENTTKIIEEKFKSLPVEIQDVIMSSSYEEVFIEIGKLYNMQDESLDMIARETTMTIMGLKPLENLGSELINELQVNKPKIDQIIHFLNETVFKNKIPLITEVFNKNNTQEEIESILDPRFSKLPQTTKKIVMDSNYQATLYAIAREYNLTVTQIGSLEEIVTSLIVGDVQPEKFEDLVEEDLQLTSEVANKLTAEVNEKVFQKIRSQVMALGEHAENQKDLEILSSHGIEIIDESKPRIPTPFKNSPATTVQGSMLELETTPEKEPNVDDVGVDQTVKIQIKKIPEASSSPVVNTSMLSQKLSGTMQMPSVRTAHTLDKISKDDEKGSLTITPSKPRFDPYREIPE